jgi:hypothetical protein
MTDFSPQTARLACPVCGAPVQAEIHNLIDVGLEPELKEKLLRGHLNVARCTNCGGEGLVAAPIVYHDPGKELLLAFIPPEVDLKDEERQRIIGDLTNLILSYLPPEKRKGYLLVPKELLTYQSLIETILQADGITREVIEAQRTRMELIDRLWKVLDDTEQLQELVTEVDEKLDFEFFATLGAFIEANRQDDREEYVTELEGLREKLLELSTYGRKVVAQMLQGSPDHPPLSREALLDKLLAALDGEEQELADLVTWYRSAVDYQFFQMLTTRMETAEKEGALEKAERFRKLRETLLEITERIDQETKLALEEAAELLRQLLGAEDPASLIRERLDDFDDAFFIVLGANLQAAEEAGQEEVQQRLQELGNQVLEIAQERLPPEVRLIRRLLAVPDDDTARALLQENSDRVDEEFVALMHDLAGEVQEGETQDRMRHLAQLAEEQIQQES